MEEKDIDIVEDMINNCKEHIKIYDEAFVDLEEIKSVEKLLQAYKQDEKVIEAMAKYFEGYEINDLITLNSQKEAIDYFRKKCE